MYCDSGNTIYSEGLRQYIQAFNMTHLEDLIQISRYYGNNPEYIIAGGGNTSYKNEDFLYIKASGISLATIDEKGFVKMSREGLALIEEKNYPENSLEREQEVKADLAAAVAGEQMLRPSVETSLHNLIDYRFIVHTHPTVINGLMCSNDAELEVKKRFGVEALYMEYTDPGYILFKELQKKIRQYERELGKAPQVIFLQNHGIFIGANSVEEIKAIYEHVDRRIGEGVDVSLPNTEASAYESETVQIIHQIFSARGLVSKAIESELTSHFLNLSSKLEKIQVPFSPDIIVYCKSNYLILENGLQKPEIESRISSFENKHGYYPKVILVKDGGLIAVEENENSVNTVLEVYQDMMKITYLSEQFGGPHTMTPSQIQFIDNWEVENYRRSVAKS